MSASSYVLLIGAMALGFSVATDFTFQAPWPWWLIPAAFALLVVVIVGHRLRARRARRALDAERIEMEALSREVGLDNGGQQ